MFHERAFELKRSKRRENGIKIKNNDKNMHYFYCEDLFIVPASTVVAATVRPTPSSRHRRATFPAIGKVYPTKIA